MPARNATHSVVGGQRTLAVQVEVPVHHKLYADQFRVEVPAPASLYAQGHGAALLLPFILGLGMALPWPLAGAGLACLPKPGRWMERIKHGFGVLILLAAVYYAWTGLSIWRQQPPSGAWRAPPCRPAWPRPALPMSRHGLPKTERSE